MICTKGLDSTLANKIMKALRRRHSKQYPGSGSYVPQLVLNIIYRLKYSHSLSEDEVEAIELALVGQDKDIPVKEWKIFLSSARTSRIMSDLGD